MKKRKYYKIILSIFIMILAMQFNAYAGESNAKKQGIESIEVLNSTR